MAYVKALYAVALVLCSIAFSQPVFAAESQSTVTIAIGSTTAPVTPPPSSTTTPTTTPSTVQFGNGAPVSVSTGEVSGFAPLQIQNRTIIPTLTSATVSWQTNRLAHGRVQWGTTLDFELGTIESAEISEAHAMTLAGLIPGQTYFASVVAVGSDGQVARDSNIRFEALKNFELGIVPNVSNFTLQASQSAVVGTWDNPTVPDFDLVRVVRSERFFPRDPVDGVVVYEGRGTQFVDTAIVPGQTYFYALFTRSTAGVFSSGAVQAITIATTARPTEGTATPAAPSPDEPVPSRELSSLQLDDFIFRDATTELRFVDSELFLTQGHSITIVLPLERLPSSVKTIVATFGTTTDTLVTTGFLLRQDASKSSFEAVLPVFENPGEQSFSIDIFGYDNTRIKRLSGRLEIIASEGEKAPSADFDFIPFAFLLFVFIGSLFLAVLSRKLYTRLSM